jgi:uncharacterized membrane protein HdeD (DUF308 family)
MNANKEITRKVRWSIVWSVPMIVAGALAIIVPPATGMAVTRLVGWLLVLSGATHLAYAWHTRSDGGHWTGMLLGIIYIVAGGYVLLHLTASLASLMLVLSLYLFVESILEFILSYQLRPLVGSSWLRFDGMVTLILALILAFIIWAAWPVSSTWVIGILVGTSMLFSGVARLMVSLAPRDAAAAPHEEFHEME